MIKLSAQSDDLWPQCQHALRLATHKLPSYLCEQRWYPAKSAGRPEVTLQCLIPLRASRAGAIAIWAVTPPGQSTFHVFLPLALLSPEAIDKDAPAVIGQTEKNELLVDAFASDSFVRGFVDLMVHPPDESELQCGRVAQSSPLSQTPASQWRIQRSTAEQSNTSIRIGEQVMLKVIRKVSSGIHPELEMSRFLTRESPFDAVPSLLGWLNVQESTLAILQAFIPNEGDGWNWVGARLTGGSDERARALRFIAKLGERTAEMHRALAETRADVAFQPERAEFSDWTRWTQELQRMAHRVQEVLNSKDLQLDADARRARDEFARRIDEVGDAARHWIGAAPNWAKTRLHGDFHLGQVLVRGDDCTIVDFEGEPLRPLAERRAKQVPLKDVAGMLRSFEYAVASVKRAWPESLSTSDRADRSMQLEGWVEAASRLYLVSYFGNLARTGFEPIDEAAARRIVQFFTLQKALYEVLYEAANRPSWIAIPLAGVLRLLDEFKAAGATPAAGGTARVHQMPYGAQIQTDAGAEFRFWAPECAAVDISLDSPGDACPRIERMIAAEGGWHTLRDSHARAGTRYRYRLPNGMCVPDPASRFQPEDVHGPSEVIDPSAYEWRDTAWVGRPWHEAVIYELHVGAFTTAGTFSAVIDRLDHLAALGITAIELMPLADFPGGRNWGYDGVLLYAPDSSYGRPEDLKALVDAAHERGMMVLLDVVYNHFGPDGNYLPLYAPQFFTERHKTPWGAAVNYDGRDAQPVREFIIHNALYWIEEYHLDGLRLDAVHAILDDGPTHLLEELAERVRASQLRPIHLLLENEENQVRWLQRDSDGAAPLYSAQWNDDMHHVLHVAATGEDKGYYADYLNSTEKLARALAEGFAYQGEMMTFRGEARGEPSASLPPLGFVAFIQNHDQIGNRAFGERLSSIAPAEAVRALAALYLLLPQVPMLFMGEEWGSTQPFPFFCDFHGDLAEAVRRGRREEFARFPEFKDEALRARIPDPQDIGTFLSAKLHWAEVQEPDHAAWLEFYQRLLAVRREVIWSLLPRMQGHAGRYQVLGEGAVRVTWQIDSGGQLALEANLSAVPVQGFESNSEGVLWEQGAWQGGDAGPWCVRWSIRAEAGS